MIQLATYFTLDVVSLDVEATSRKRLFEDGALLLERSHGISHEEIFDALTQRERLGSTSVGHGCALPHARLDSMTEPAIALIRTQTGIDYDSVDDEPVNLFLFLIVPSRDPEQHLELLQRCALLLSDSAMRNVLRCASSSREICQAIWDWDQNH